MNKIKHIGAFTYEVKRYTDFDQLTDKPIQVIERIITVPERGKFAHLFFKFYLWLHFKEQKSYEKQVNNVYDHLGIIDTLGSRSDSTKHTYSYSCELYSVWGIKFLGIKFQQISE